MADADTFTNYSTVSPLFKGTPGWVPTLERERVQSYDTYDQLYWNHNSNIKLLMRGTDDIDPIYVPEAKVIVNTTDRYVGPGLTWVPDPAVGTPDSRLAATSAFAALLRRERFKSRYNANKLFGLVRGDWCWHISADMAKPQGSRLRILPVHPGNYFPIPDPDDADRITKVFLAERLLDNAGKAYVKRHTYYREVDGGPIFSVIETFDEDKWFLDGVSGKEVLQPPTQLDPRITAWPVYHIPTADSEPGQFWGSSVLRGAERIIAGLTQALSDEDMALALEGLGVYYTENSAQPRAADGTPTEWTLYPGRIIAGAVLNRVQGIGSLGPYGEHIERMRDWVREANAIVDVAVGRVDASIAESGISLALQLGPMLAASSKKDDAILDVHAQMGYDLVQGWFPAYEQLNFTDVDMVPQLAPKIPPNVDAEVNMASMLVTAGIMSKKTARERLTPLGFTFAEDEDTRLAGEAAQAAAAAAPNDQFAAQQAQDQGAVIPDGTNPGAATG